MLVNAAIGSKSSYFHTALSHDRLAQCGGGQRYTRHRHRNLQIAFGRRRKYEYEEPEPEIEEYTQEPVYEQGIDPTPPPAVQERGVPLYISIPGALLVLFAAFRIFKKLQSRG